MADDLTLSILCIGFVFREFVQNALDEMHAFNSLYWIPKTMGSRQVRKKTSFNSLYWIQQTGSILWVGVGLMRLSILCIGFPAVNGIAGVLALGYLSILCIGFTLFLGDYNTPPYPRLSILCIGFPNPSPEDGWTQTSALSILCIGFTVTVVTIPAKTVNGFQFFVLDSGYCKAGQVARRGGYFQFFVLDSPPTQQLGYSSVETKTTFNSLYWILPFILPQLITMFNDLSILCIGFTADLTALHATLPGLSILCIGFRMQLASRAST